MTACLVVVIPLERLGKDGNLEEAEVSESR